MTSTPHHRHQSSLEGVISFSSESPLGATERARARDKFYRIVNHFATDPGDSNNKRQYNRPLLVRFTYEYTRSEESKDIFLRAFFQALDLQIDSEDDIHLDKNDSESEHLQSGLTQFADYLFENFFLPCKIDATSPISSFFTNVVLVRASSGKTPQPSRRIYSAIQRAQGGGVQDFVGTPERVSALRDDCLLRDRYRCVISGRFDYEEAKKRMQRSGPKAVDDDGNLLLGESFESLEVAHIIPHALTKSENGSELHPSKKAALDVLNMFDSGVVHLIEGNDIDRPRNAISLSHTYHHAFGNFEIFFEPVPSQEHTYQIQTFLPRGFMPDLPVRRTLFLTESRTIDPPLPRFLAIHRAIAYILHLSGAGAYIEKILENMKWKDTRADGSTELGHLVALRMGGWLDHVINV